jgi:3'(2'), 5'-bisphosphate nucleotidase
VAQACEFVGDELLDALTLIVSRAAAAIMAVQSLNPREKPDKSPVTAADEASEALILRELAQAMPGVPIVSEEANRNRGIEPPGQRFFVIDPLDGTRELLAGRDEFAVNLALVDAGVPVVGIIAAPARGVIWRGVTGGGAERLVVSPGAAPRTARERTAIRTRKQPAEGPTVVTSRSHLDAATIAYIDRLAPPERTACGSALKFCLIAEGAADLYPRLAPTSDWDVAAGHALVLAAGGGVTAPDGRPLRYGQRDLLIPAFIAFGDREGGPPR